MDGLDTLRQNDEGRKRVVIEDIRPRVDGGDFAVKRVAGDEVLVTTDLYADGHDSVAGVVLYRKENDTEWWEVPLIPLVNDRWEGRFPVEEPGEYFFTVSGWVDHFQTWKKDLQKKYQAGQDVKSELSVGAGYIMATASRATGSEKTVLLNTAEILEEKKNVEKAVERALEDELSLIMSRYPDRRWATVGSPPHRVYVDRKKASFSTWYELFPRSWSEKPGDHGTFRDVERLLPEIARMGFDVLYFPPIHPIGTTNRKGQNNSPHAQKGDPGCPWAIGSPDGGHGAIHPELGTFDDFRSLLEKARNVGIEVALDLAFQCSPDHPYLVEHPEWFKWRPDGTIQYAENPPKKYEDVVPINFDCENWHELWLELKRVVLFWIEQGVTIFRVDNPHTKPFLFWDWLINEVKKDHPEALFLSEAFTRPKIMYRLAKLGFSQSYTYFTWRNSKKEFIDYLTELTRTPVREFFRPNFWPNTPDILPQHLQFGGRAAFPARLVLAATLSSNYGIYGPVFELLENRAVPGKEEYQNSEKYQIQQWNWDAPGNLKEFIALVNKIRRENPALQETNNITFLEIDNDFLLCYVKGNPTRSNLVITAVNLDFHRTQSGWVRLPLERLGIDPEQPFLVHDLLSDARYIWQGEWNYIELNPELQSAHIFQVYHRMRREEDFDYFM